MLYLKDHYFKIECLDETFKIMESTVDGEMGPDMPFDVKVIPKAIPVFGKFAEDDKHKPNIMEFLKNAGVPTKL